jgi:hypothetical protein
MIIVTGMHRSGTSMTASLLAGLGAPFGAAEDMIAADQWNQSGYFESKEAVAINLRLLLGLGVNVDTWLYPLAKPSARLTSAFTSGKWRYLLPASQAKMERRAKALAPDMDAFLIRSKGLFVKDPRFAVTYRLWRARGPVEGTIFCFRHPEAVRRSIAKRDLMPRAIATRMWLQHNRGFIEALSGDEPVLLVDYDAFFSPDAGARVERLAAFVNRFTARSTDAAGAVGAIDLKQRHHETADLPIGSREAAAVYNAIRQVSATQDTALPASELRLRLLEAGSH